MAKANKGVLWTLLKVLLVIAIIIVFLLLGLYLVLRFALGIDIFAIRKQVKLLSTLPDESTYISSPIALTDLSSAKTKFIAADLGDLFGESDFDGLINSLESGTSTATLSSDIYLTDKEFGAIINSILQDAIDEALSESEYKDVGIDLLQITFNDVSKSTTALYNKTSCKVEISLKLNITSLATTFRKFPLSILTKKAPNYIYAKTSFTITNTQDIFGFTFEPDNITLNTLTQEQTSKLFDTIKFLNLGTSTQFCTYLADIFTSIAIKATASDGFLSYLSYAGAKGFYFESIEGINYLVIDKE